MRYKASQEYIKQLIQASEDAGRTATGHAMSGWAPKPFSQAIPSHVPLKKDGTPDMRCKVSKDYVKQLMQEKESGSLKVGNTSITTATTTLSPTKPFSQSIPAHIPLKKDGTPDMRYKVSKDYVKQLMQGSGQAARAGRRGEGGKYNSGGSSSSSSSSSCPVPLKSDGTPWMSSKQAQDYINQLILNTSGREEEARAIQDLCVKDEKSITEKKETAPHGELSSELTPPPPVCLDGSRTAVVRFRAAKEYMKSAILESRSLVERGHA